MDLELAHVRKVFCDGTHRAEAPKETEKAARPLMESVGVERVQDITRKDRVGIPCFVARRHHAPPWKPPFLPRHGKVEAPCPRIRDDGCNRTVFWGIPR